MISLLSAGLHTCDQRRSKQSISNDFPIVEFENGFNDHDLLWTKDFQETDKQLDIRIRAALTNVFLDPMSANLTCKRRVYGMLETISNSHE